MEKKLVALMPIKANSERVKGKNFKPFAGKPLYRWMLDTLLGMKEVDLVVINTDAKNIFLETGIAESDRLIFRNRRAEICGDFVSMNLILQDDIESIPAATYLMTHATNPNISAQTVRAGYQYYLEAKKSEAKDSLFSVNKFQARFYRKDASPVNHDLKVLLRTQDLDPWYLENSCLYFFSRESFKKTGARIGERPALFETTLTESIDIDDQETWDLAEVIAKAGLK